MKQKQSFLKDIIKIYNHLQRLQLDSLSKNAKCIKWNIPYDFMNTRLRYNLIAKRYYFQFKKNATSCLKRFIHCFKKNT